MHKRKIEPKRPHNLKPHQVQAHFLHRGTTLKSWALDQGHKPSTVNMALRGERDGAVSRKIIKQLKRELQAK